MASEGPGAHRRFEFERERFWAEAVRQYGPRLRAYLARTRGGGKEIDEMVWDVWAIAVADEDRIRGVADAWPALHRIAQGVAKRRVQQWRHEESLLVDDLVPDAAAAADWGDENNEASAAKTLAGALRRDWAGLSPRQQEALELHVLKGWTYDQVASALSIREATVRWHVMQGIRGLRAVLDGGSTQIGPPAAQQN